jgi:hypothetical protein
MNLDILYPLIVPGRYISNSNWDLPHHAFPNNDYILTWVFFSSESTMTYIKSEQFTILNNNYPDWQKVAFENLRNSLGKSGNFYTNYRAKEDGQSLSFIIFSNEDGIGSSRILYSYEFEQAFPEGYNVAMPDRAFGIVISKNISTSDQEILKNIIDKYYGCTRTAMSKLVMPPTDFLLPKEWVEPLDPDLSQWMIDEILKYNE